MGETQGQMRAYRCRAGGFLLRSDQPHGVIHDVYCTKCKRRHDVYLGGRKGNQARSEAETRDGDGAGLAFRGVRAVG